MSSTQGSDLWNEGLKLVSFCPVCETRYNPMEARMLGQDGDTHFLHVQCRKCQNSILAMVLINEVGASSVGLLTDLSYEDVLRFRARKSVTVNDVIDVHKQLKAGGWQKILGKRYGEKVQRTAVKRQKKNM